MEIIKFKKISNGKYKVITNENEMVLYEDVILKYNLLSTKKVNLELLHKLLKDNEYYEVYNLSIKYIEIRMRSKIELIRYLEKKKFDSLIINSVVNKLEEINLLNDSNYLKAYINDKINLSDYGPNKIKEELLRNEIKEEEINEYLNTLDASVWLNRIKKHVDKKIKLNRNKSIIYLKKILYNELLYKGYSIELINEVLNEINMNDDESFKKEYDKAYKKLSKKYSDEKLKLMIKNELYKKGFNFDRVSEYYME